MADLVYSKLTKSLASRFAPLLTSKLATSPSLRQAAQCKAVFPACIRDEVGLSEKSSTSVSSSLTGPMSLKVPLREKV